MTSVDPDAGGQNGTRSVVIRGGGFGPGATPSFSGVGIAVLDTTFKSANRLSAQIEIAPDAATGARDVAVTNTDGTRARARRASRSTPRRSRPRPRRRGRAPAPTVDVDVLGSDFQPGAVVKVPGNGITVNSTTFVSSGDLRASFTVEPNAPLRRAAVKVVDPDGGRGTCTACLTIVSP